MRAMGMGNLAQCHRTEMMISVAVVRLQLQPQLPTISTSPKSPKEELDHLANNFPSRFSVYYVLNQPPEGWDCGIGFVSKEMIQTHCPPPGSDIQILRCGPPPMNKAVAAHLDALGYTPPNAVPVLSPSGASFNSIFPPCVVR